MTKLRFIPLFLFAVLLFTCNEGESERLTRIEMPVTTFGTNPESFIMITNQDNEVLATKYGLGNTETLAFDASPSDELDFTYGIIFANSSSFLLTTYRNISPDFVYTGTFLCGDENFDEITPFGVAPKVLTIENFKGRIVFSPLRAELVSGDNVELSGISIDDDITLTIQEGTTGTYKSIFIEKEEWTDQNDGTYSLVLNGADIPEAQVHVINTNVASPWYVRARVKQPDGTEFLLSEQLGQSQEAAFGARIYYPQNIAFQNVDVNIKSASFNGYEYNIRNAESFPARADFVENDLDFVETDATQYQIDNRVSAAQVRVDYSYIVDNFLSFWKIYQKRDVDLDYNLPSLPNQFLEAIDGLDMAIQNPRSINVTSIHAEDVNSTEQYFENLGDRMFCIEHTDSFNGKSL